MPYGGALQPKLSSFPFCLSASLVLSVAGQPMEVKAEGALYSSAPFPGSSSKNAREKVTTLHEGVGVLEASALLRDLVINSLHVKSTCEISEITLFRLLSGPDP